MFGARPSCGPRRSPQPAAAVSTIAFHGSPPGTGRVRSHLAHKALPAPTHSGPGAPELRREIPDPLRPRARVRIDDEPILGGPVRERPGHSRDQVEGISAPPR